VQALYIIDREPSHVLHVKEHVIYCTHHY